MKKFISVFILLFTLSCYLTAKNLMYGPWVHNVTETGFTVLWITSKPSLDYVQVAPDDETPFESCKRPEFYETRYGRRVFTTFHTVTIDGLNPGTAYKYRIVSKVVNPESNAYSFVYGKEETITPKPYCSAKTLSKKADTCRFSMVNDIHFNDSRYSALVSKINPKNTDFLVLCGDIVSKCESIDTVIKHTFAPVASQTQKIPLVTVRGNHETRGADFYIYKNLFPTRTGEFYYVFRHGPAAFIILDGGEDKPDTSCEYGGTAEYDTYRQTELEWLKTAVKEPQFVSAPVKICLIHIPTIDVKDSWYSQKWITKNFAPVLEKAGITVALSGHHHKWIVSEAGKDGKAYPVIVNSNKERMDVVVTGNSISIKTFDTEGNECHSWERKLRNK